MPSITGLIIACCVIYYSAHGYLADKQIVGGMPVLDGQYYPYQVSLKNPHTRKHLCGGAIVSKRYVITAAHCLDNRATNLPYPPTNVIIDVGSNLLYSQTSYTAEALIPHPDYNKELIINDIGLIKLENEIIFDDNTKPIALIPSDQNFDGVPLIVTGWGHTSPNSQIYELLQQITVKGCSQEKCAQTWKDITKTQICTLEPLGYGVCNGDSGGALTYNNTLVGIVSFGKKECASGYPDVFTRVFYYRDWVNEYINEKSLFSTKYINAGSNQQLNILLGLFTTYLCVFIHFCNQ